MAVLLFAPSRKVPGTLHLSWWLYAGWLRAAQVEVVAQLRIQGFYLDMDVQGVHGCTGLLLFGPRSDLETIFLFFQDAILARQKP